MQNDYICNQFGGLQGGEISIKAAEKMGRTQLGVELNCTWMTETGS